MERPIIDAAYEESIMTTVGLKKTISYKAIYSRFQYCLIARKEGDIEKCVVYSQLKRIQQRYSSDQTGRFDICYMDCFDNSPTKKENRVIFLIKADPTLASNVAGLLGLMVYNRKWKFLEKFDPERAEEFERFNDIKNQTILLHLLRQEFDVEEYLRAGLLLDSFPLHNYIARDQLRSALLQKGVLLENFVDNFVFVGSNHNFLRPLTIVANYFGKKVD